MNIRKLFFGILLVAIVASVCAIPVFAASEDTAPAIDNITAAADSSEDDAVGSKALAAAIAVGLAAAGGAVGMGIAVSKSTEGISRQPEAEGKIRTTMMLGLVFIETAIIYALVIAILVIFVL